MRILVTGGSGFIGTNLVEYFLKKNYEVLNVDLERPMDLNQEGCWKCASTLDREELVQIFQEFRPNCVVDLAARTDCDEDTTVWAGYHMNIDGPANILHAIEKSETVVRAIFTSTQYVKRPGPIAESDEDYDPHTVYGESKVLMEKMIRASNIPCTWTIIRPTNVWGPWHLRYKNQFIRVVRSGLYLHPGNETRLKSYAFVGTVVEQIGKIICTGPELVDKKTFYVGDAPLSMLEWVNAFSNELTGHDVRVVPAGVVAFIAKVGDFISALSGRPFLISTARFNSMLGDYLTPMEKTFSILGNPPYSLNEGVAQTLAWIDKYDKEHRN